MMRALETWVTGPWFWTFPLVGVVVYLGLAWIVLGPYRKSR